MKYFAYGSNMSLGRIRSRIDSANILGTYILNDHELRFHKMSEWDGSAKCDVHYTGEKINSVVGVLYHIKEKDKRTLDNIEGLGKGYEEKEVTLYSVKDHSEQKAVTYYATKIDSGLLPYSWYLEHVITGAQEAGVPEKYIRKLERTETIKDSDKSREEKELAIYSVKSSGQLQTR